MKRGRSAVEGNIIQYVKELERRISALERQEAVVNQLSELSGDLGDVTFGDGAGRLNGDGITIIGAEDYEPEGSLKTLDGDGNIITNIYSSAGALSNDLYLITESSAGKDSNISVYARSPSTYYSSVILGSLSGSTLNVTLKIYSDNNGDSYIKINNSRSDADTFIYGTNPDPVLTVDAGDNDIDIATKMNFGNTGVLTGGIQALNDDSAASFTPATPQGALLIASTADTGTLCGIVVYNTATPTTYIMAGGSNTAVTTGALAGTTGTDGKFTVSCHTDGKIYLENRRGGARTVRWQILAGTVS